MMARVWASGWFRLFVVVLVFGAIGGAIAVARHKPKPTAAERAKAERLRLVRLHHEQVQLRRKALRDPALRRERARLRAEQAAHFGHARPGRGSRARQKALVAALEQSITADARRRHREGKFDKRTIDTVCEHLVRPEVVPPPPPPVDARSAGYECTAATTRIHTDVSQTGTAIFGFPFWARVNFATGHYVWCKINLLPSEHGIGDSLATVPLPAACDLLKSGGPA